MIFNQPLRALVADDEPLARARLRNLLEACAEPAVEVLSEVGSATAAQTWLNEHACDVVFLDIEMPGSGLRLAEALKSLTRPPLVVFVTAHTQHALDAFGLDAVDYLTKPVRPDRLQAALARAAHRREEREAARRWSAVEAPPEDALSLTERGRVVRVPVSEVLYVKAELKYLTVRTAQQRHVMDGSLNDLEARLGDRFLRIHRNALVALSAVRELEHRPAHEAGEDDGAEGWSVRVAPVDEWLAVSRRQLAAVRETLRKGAGR